MMQTAESIYQGRYHVCYADSELKSNRGCADFGTLDELIEFGCLLYGYEFPQQIEAYRDLVERRLTKYE